MPHDVVELQGSWVSPGSIIEYLQGHGWHTRGGREDLYERFLPPDLRVGSSVVVPINPEMADFRNLIEDAVASIADEAGIESQRLLAHLDLGIGDTVRFRKEMSSPHGSIPWTTGEALVLSSTRLLEAGAKAERGRAQYYGNRYWTFARSYLDEVRMGQTEDGSYVVTALTPIGALANVEVPLLPEFGDPSTGRAITETLFAALGATSDAVDYYNRRASLDAFQDAVRYGVSYELTRGLIGLVSNSDGAEVAVIWNDRQSPASHDTPSAVLFEPSALRALERASSRFAQTEPTQQVTVIGAVTLLERPRPGSAGVIRLEVIEGTQAKKLRVRLPEDMYDAAIQAHQEGKAMRVSGRQEKEGGQFWLYDPYDIELIDVDFQLTLGGEDEEEALL